MSSEWPRGLLDTSIFIATDTGRDLDENRMPLEVAISSITVGELRAGVLAASDHDSRALRLSTLEAIAEFRTLPVDDAVAASWALLRVHLAEAGRRVNANDLWIAATAVRHGLPVVTQDEDFNALDGLAGLEVIRV